jgi:hypothetical protein
MIFAAPAAGQIKKPVFELSFFDFRFFISAFFCGVFCEKVIFLLRVLFFGNDMQRISTDRL